MMILQVNQLSKSFGADTILNNIKLEVRNRDRIAIVGRNGAGKSTLLKIIAGQLSYEKGEIIKPKDITMGYLAQHTGLDSKLTIKEELLTVFDHLKAMEKEMRAIEEKMAAADPGELESIMKTYDRLQQEFRDKGGYQYEADVRSVLHGLGFSHFDDSTQVQSLSGGQKTRLALGKLLDRYQAAGADVTAVEGAGVLQLTARRNWDLPRLIELYRFLETDCLLIEGFKKAPYPKVVILSKEEDLEALQAVNTIAIIYRKKEHMIEHQGLPVFHADDPVAVDFVLSQLKGESA